MALKQRKTNKHHHGSKKNDAGSITSNQNDDKSKKDKIQQQQNIKNDTILQTILQHPLFLTSIFICIPYALYQTYHLLRLQRPDLASKATFGMINLRPPVGYEDERQLLIIGSMSGGTSQIASELESKLGLEIGHECSDSKWNFVRDGTVSWFHGVRFMNPPENMTERIESIQGICGNAQQSVALNMGFHPGMYQEPKLGCSYRQKWSKCWHVECIQILMKEWGCARRGDCEIKFRKNMLQVRNPLRTIESLVVKFCQNKENNILEREVHPSFLAFANAIFQEKHNFTADSCIEAAGHFVIEYNNAMIDAHRRGEIDAVYLVEESTVCDVAKAGGLMSLTDTVYGPNHERVHHICHNYGSHAQAIGVIEQKKNRINKDFLRLTWEDLRGGVHNSTRPKNDVELENAVKDLFTKLGYEISEVGEVDDTSSNE